MSDFLDEVLEVLGEDLYPRHDGMVFVAKAITFGGKNYPKYGNAVIVGGGAGSGKGYQIAQLFGLDGKRIDVDKLKEFALKNKQIQEKIKKMYGVDISNWRLDNPKQVSDLHEFLKEINLNDRYIKMVKESALMAASDRKPNLIFDKTLSSFRDFANIATGLKHIGYKDENIHLVWILNDYKVAVIQNQMRERRVPNDILLTTHEETAANMKRIVDFGDNIKQYMNGDFWISFNQAKVDVELEVGNTGGYYIKNAVYFKVKSAGGSMTPYEKIDQKFRQKIKEYIPEKVKYLWS